MTANPFLISPEALGRAIGRDGLSVIDASWYLPAQKRFPRPEFEAGHVPGAVFFDQDAVVAPGSALPHALPSAEVFAKAAGALGIRETDTIVVYDGLGLFSAPRVWWLFRLFGAKDVRVLDGGLPAWRAAGLPLETGPAAPRPATFHARFDASRVADAEAVAEASRDGSAQIVDARSAERFAGAAPEPRAGVRSGHIPGARNVHYADLATADGRLKPPEEIRAAFEAAGVDPDAPIVTSCGSGVTAAVLTLGLETLGNRSLRLYDGSWTEWGGSDRPVETGPARGSPGTVAP